MNQKWKKGVILFLGVLFFICTFLIAAPQYGLYEYLPTDGEADSIGIKAISPGTTWEYMDGGEEPGVGNVWTTQRYDSSSWKKGKGIFKTGSSVKEGDTYQVTEIESPKFREEAAATFFFRKKVNIESAKDIQSIRGSLQYSNAAIIYLNGKIIFAGNVPAGGYKSNQETHTAERIGGVQKEAFVVTDMRALVDGENIISVEVHQEGAKYDDAYFFLENLEFLESEQKEVVPDIQELMLEVGQDESEIGVNWMTDSDDFYRVEYAEAAEYKHGKKQFSKIAKAVLMGRNSVEGTEQYVNKVQMTRLKADTEYVYRVIRVGGKKGSEIMNFCTGTRKGYSFALLSDPQLSVYRKDGAQLWETSLENAFRAMGETDFILSTGDQMAGVGTLSDTMQYYEAFRSPEILKRIPIKTVMGHREAGQDVKKIYNEQFKGYNQDKNGDYGFTYQDALVVGINSNSDDYDGHRDFLQKAISKTNQKWVIVVMHHSIFSDGKSAEEDTMVMMQKAFADIFHDLNVDLVLSGHGNSYSGPSLMSGEIPSANAEGRQKEKGETLYITAAPYSAIRIDVTGPMISVNTYRTGDGTIIDSYQLMK